MDLDADPYSCVDVTRCCAVDNPFEALIGPIKLPHKPIFSSKCPPLPSFQPVTFATYKSSDEILTCWRRILEDSAFEVLWGDNYSIRAKSPCSCLVLTLALYSSQDRIAVCMRRDDGCTVEFNNLVEEFAHTMNNLVGYSTREDYGGINSRVPFEPEIQCSNSPDWSWIDDDKFEAPLIAALLKYQDKDAIQALGTKLRQGNHPRRSCNGDADEYNLASIANACQIELA